jgi:hypothetical protein
VWIEFLQLLVTDFSKDAAVAQRFIQVWVTAASLFLFGCDFKGQFKWRICPYLQNVTKTALFVEALFMSSLRTQEGAEYRNVSTVFILELRQYVSFFATFIFMHFSSPTLRTNVSAPLTDFVYVSWFPNGLYFSVQNSSSFLTRGTGVCKVGAVVAQGRLSTWEEEKLDMCDVCTMGDMAYIHMILKFLSHASAWVHRYSSLLQ